MKTPVEHASGQIDLDLTPAPILWRRTSQSDKQWRDILGVLKVQQEKLDFEYVRPWVDRFGLAEDWERAKLEAGISHLSTDSRS